MALDKNDLLSLIAANLPDNTTGAITPSLLRQVVEQMVTADANLEEILLQAFNGPLDITGALNVTEDITTTKNIFAKNILDNIVIVKQASDFGVIDSTKLYFLDGIINFTGTGLSIEIPVGGISIDGYNFETSGITCSDDNYTLFTSPVGGSGEVLIDKGLITISGANSKVFDIKAATVTEGIEFVKVSFNNCTSLGVIEGYRQGLESGTRRLGGTPELTLDGNWAGGFFIETSIVRSLTDGAYSLYKAGGSFVMTSRFKTNQNIDLPASASFLDFAPANFISPSTVQLDDCIVTRNGVFDAGDANLTPNLSATDLVSAWANNKGLSNTFVGGELVVTTEVATPIAVAGTFADLLGTYTSDDLQHFDEPANGQLRHLGESPREYKVAGQCVLDAVGNDEVDLKIVIFRAATVSFENGKTLRRVINNFQGGRDAAYFVLSDNIILDQNDYVKLQVANVNATNNITAELDSFFNVSAR